jgi:hypothetical protein
MGWPFGSGITGRGTSGSRARGAGQNRGVTAIVRSVQILRRPDPVILEALTIMGCAVNFSVNFRAVAGRFLRLLAEGAILPRSDGTELGG